jgi:hypothetical protein
MRCAGGWRGGAEKSPPQARPEVSSGNGDEGRQFKRPTLYEGKDALFFDRHAQMLRRSERRRNNEADATDEPGLKAQAASEHRTLMLDRSLRSAA